MQDRLDWLGGYGGERIRRDHLDWRSQKRGDGLRAGDSLLHGLRGEADLVDVPERGQLRVGGAASGGRDI